jgi:hypothetical protein
VLVNCYCTLQEVRDQLGDAGNKISQTLLEKAINSTCRAVDRWCGRRFWRDATTSTRRYVADDQRTVWVDDISAAAGVVVASDAGGDGVYETTWTVGTDYQLEPLNADVVAAGDTGDAFAFWQVSAIGTRWFPVWATRRPGVQVTARFGWSAMPDQVSEAAVLKAVSLYRRKDAPFGVAGFGEFGVVRITRKDVDVVDLLTPFAKTRPRTLTFDPQGGSLFHGRQLGQLWP